MARDSRMSSLTSRAADPSSARRIGTCRSTQSDGPKRTGNSCGQSCSSDLATSASGQPSHRGRGSTNGRARPASAARPSVQARPEAAGGHRQFTLPSHGHSTRNSGRSHAHQAIRLTLLLSGTRVTRQRRGVRTASRWRGGGFKLPPLLMETTAFPRRRHRPAEVCRGERGPTGLQVLQCAGKHGNLCDHFSRYGRRHRRRHG